MNAVFASGVQSYQAASASFAKAADKVVNARADSVRASTIPQTSRTGASTPGAPAASPPPIPPAGGRAPSSPEAVSGAGQPRALDDAVISGVVAMIRAEQQAGLAATSIRAADEMTGVLLDATA